MSIIINGITSSYQSKLALSKSESRTASAIGGAPNYDALTINTSPQKEESRFASRLAQKISEQVKVTASTDRIEQLRQQVADDTYSISPQEIVSRILMTSGGTDFERI